MTEPKIEALGEKLDNVLGRLKASRDPIARRTLLAEMRVLMAQLDRVVLDPNRLHKAKPDPPR